MVKLSLNMGGDGTFIGSGEWPDIVANREAYREQGLLPRYLKAPLIGLWEITGRCNLRCVYCYNESPRTPPDLEWPIMERLAQEFIKMRIFSACVSGGEPTLHPRYIDILRLLHEGGISVGTITNGWTMTPELARSMIRYAGSAQVSLDGPSAEVHDRVRGRQGSFERAVRAIRLLRDAGFKEVSVSFAATRLNVDSFPEMPEFCAGLGVASLRTQPLAMVGRARGETDLEPTPEQTRRQDEFLKASGGKYGDLKIEWGDPSVHVTIGLGLGMAVAVRITQNGDFGLTPYYPIYFGNAREAGLAEVWEQGLRLGWEYEAVRTLLGGAQKCPVLRAQPELEKPLHIAVTAPRSS